MKFRWKTKESVRVLAASKGLSVEAMTDVMESMTRMASRFHKGQFYLSVSACLFTAAGAQIRGDHLGRRLVEAPVS